jgi:hypothetical protein
MTAIEIAAQELLDAWDDMASKLNNGHKPENLVAIERLRNAKADLRIALRNSK